MLEPFIQTHSKYLRHSCIFRSRYRSVNFKVSLTYIPSNTVTAQCILQDTTRFYCGFFLVVILCIPCGMMTSSNGIICRVTGPLCEEFTGHPSQRPVTRSFDVFSDRCLNSRLSKQSWGWWFETLDCAYELILMRTGQLSGNKIHKTPQSRNRVPISVNTKVSYDQNVSYLKMQFYKRW